MVDRIVTVPDSLELPAAVKVPSARLSDSTATGRSVLTAADAAAARTAIGAAGTVGQPFAAAVPAATFGPDLTPASLGGWTLSGGATWDSPNLTIPSGGSASCAIPVVSGKTYQVEVTRSSSSGGDMVVSIGTASTSSPSWGNRRVTMIATETGSLSLTIGGGGSWSATVQAITCREVTATPGPALSPGSAQIRASGTNVALGHASQRSLTTGNSNVALGYASQYSLTTGNSNVALGYASQYSLTTGNSNVALGYASQRSLTTGNSNVALGYDSQYRPRGIAAWATTSAGRQVSIGQESGQGSSAPSDDIVTVGYRAVADGNKAMALGSMASAAHAGSVALGADVTTTATGQVAIGPRDLEVQDAAKGVVLRSPDGSRWRTTISNAGVATWTKL